MTRPISEIRDRLRAIDSAIEGLRQAGAEIPHSLTTERYELSRELASVISDSLLNPKELGTRQAAGRVFVIMPFRDPFDTYYKEVIKSACIEAGFEVSRSDEIYSAGAFVQTIWTQILAADAVIAEMSGANPNVLYELGLCHAIDQKVIMIAQDLNSVPSDLRHMNCITYDTSRVNWSDELKDSLRRMLTFPASLNRNTILHPVARVDNTRLFEQLESQIREANVRAREKELEFGEAADRLEAANQELEQLRLLLGDEVRSRRQADSVLIHKDNGIDVALVPLPGQSDQVLDFINIPEGDFIFGDGGNSARIWLPSYWISRYSVTNAQYCSFLNEVGLQEEQGVPWIDLEAKSPADHCRIVLRDGRFHVDSRYANHPVTYVNYYGAEAFCQWVGGTLPTAEQWEKAARGTDRLPYACGS